MKNEVDTLIEQYYSWLKERSSTKEVSGWIEITTPYLDVDNDRIQIYAKAQDGNFILSDGGNTLSSLSLMGISVDKGKRRQLFENTLTSYGITRSNNELQIQAGSTSFPQRKHAFMQAILTLNDMFYLSQGSVPNIFFEEVQEWFEENSIRSIPNTRLVGKSGYENHFDFAIPRSKVAPERLVLLANRPTKDYSIKMAFSWLDIKDTRAADTVPFVILNDSEKKIGDNVLEALNKYEMNPTLWGDRETVISRLAS